uniref:Uncharacterized protein n=1 Tax=Anopheles arabiensis TaxID=7173 RepID=A0A182IGM3_ANOAR
MLGINNTNKIAEAETNASSFLHPTTFHRC